MEQISTLSLQICWGKCTLCHERSNDVGLRGRDGGTASERWCCCRMKTTHVLGGVSLHTWLPRNASEFLAPFPAQKSLPQETLRKYLKIIRPYDQNQEGRKECLDSETLTQGSAFCNRKYHLSDHHNPPTSRDTVSSSPRAGQAT